MEMQGIYFWMAVGFFGVFNPRLAFGIVLATTIIMHIP